MQSLTPEESTAGIEILRENKRKMPVVMAIIPAYNEARNIKKIALEASKYVTSVIVVDDGSNDNTVAEIANNMNVKVIRNGHNRGKGVALRRGIIESLKYNPDVIVTLDADGQHNPADIPKLIKPIESGDADIVIGSRYSNNSLIEVPRFRRIGLSIINFMNRSIVKTVINDSQSGYRAYSKSVLNIIVNYDSTGYGVETEQLAAAEAYGFRIVEVPVTIRYNGLQNTSKKNSVLHGANIVSTILKIIVERRPLMFFGLIGIILIGMAIITGSDMLVLFNKTRYFSIPLALVTLGFALIGSLLILISLVFYVLKRIRERQEMITNFFDLMNKAKSTGDYNS
jgi:glycosyltransferase involved in cell wall biosynthesis